MADVKNLLRQHNEILELIGKINAFTTSQQIEANAFSTSLLLGQLAGKIKIHMTTEDKFVYPALLNHANPKVQSLSRQFADEMGDLAKTFDSYKTKYMNAREISANPASFLQQTKLVAAALATRIEKENTELYPLL
ncbi:MAG: hemerythrin domain-containing protein [Veillonellaceae bacterium]|jgi:hypothetical protein|nr:hemerythrin domain-containing protein [Veillonellaceae bacterium]